MEELLEYGLEMGPVEYCYKRNIQLNTMYAEQKKKQPIIEDAGQGRGGADVTGHP
jgi:hypothetical protein